MIKKIEMPTSAVRHLIKGDSVILSLLGDEQGMSPYEAGDLCSVLESWGDVDISDCLERQRNNG